MKREVMVREDTKTNLLVLFTIIGIVTLLVVFVTTQVTSCARYEQCVQRSYYDKKDTCAEENRSLLEEVLR